MWFLEALCAANLFDTERARRFASCPILFPSPALAAVPTGMLRAHMQVCQAAWREFSARHYVPRSGYQRRVAGFLLERLHSFLILEAVVDKQIATGVRGHQIIVSDSTYVAPSS